MVNVNELKAAIVRKGYCQKDVADKLGITARTLSSKMKKGVFGSDEIEILIEYLSIDNPMSIFFNHIVTR